MTKKAIIPIQRIEKKIYLIRKHKVMLDKDLAELYGVEVKNLKRQVRRNIDRFPLDFMFQLTEQEFKNWRCQIVTSNSGDKMGLRYKPYAFTENGVAMLSSVLNSERAIEVNIRIMRVFTNLRQMLTTHADLKRKMDAIEKKYDEQFAIVFQVIQELITSPEKPRKKIGFRR
ncbi:ORF6N domain-containing protein [bacterium]|nr:ORF6N domain-containing protein [bacterium]